MKFVPSCWRPSVPETVAFRRIVKLELFCYDDHVEDIVKAISGAARTCELGDGKVFIHLHLIARAYRIRTGETDEEAIWFLPFLRS
jgi:nitrogen regulatory protein P-II 2